MREGFEGGAISAMAAELVGDLSAEEALATLA